MDFIDNRLPRYDPAFTGSPSAFDSVSNRYVPRLQPASILGLAPPGAPAQAAVIIPDAEMLDAQSMEFWDDLFPNAMGQLETVPEPKNLSKSGGIRTATSWKDICDRLSSSRDTYTGEEGVSGMFRKGRRKVADNLSQPAAHIAKLVPDIDPWVTPVVGTVGLLVQAMSTAAKARQDVLKSLADLDRTFLDINRFAATFPRDPHVKEASVALVVAIFQAVERAMSFFAQSTGGHRPLLPTPLMVFVALIVEPTRVSQPAKLPRLSSRAPTTKKSSWKASTRSSSAAVASYSKPKARTGREQVSLCSSYCSVGNGCGPFPHTSEQ